MNAQSRRRIDEIIDTLNDLSGLIEELEAEETEAFENLPEPFQISTKGEAIEAAITHLSEANGNLDSAVESLLNAIEPQ